jgi:WD40 repeat protein
MHPHYNNRLLILLTLLAAAGCGSEPATKSPPGSTAAGSTAPADKSEPSTPAPPGPANQPAGRRALAEPSPEQLAKWALPNYHPLRLLACYDGFSDPAVHCLAVSPDGKQFVLGGAKLTLWIRQEPEPAVELLARYKPGDVERPIRSLAISADGKWLAAGDENGMVRIWTLSDQQEVVAFQAHQGYLTNLAFSPESRLLATTSFSGHVDLWQLPEAKKLKSLKMGKYELRSLAFLSETQLASAGTEPNIWNVETGEQETALTTKPVIGPALGLSSDRRLLAFSDADSGVQLWDVANSKQSGVALRGGGAHLIAFSQDGKWIATYSGNSEIRIWDAAAGRLMQVIDADGGPGVASRLCRTGRGLGAWQGADLACSRRRRDHWYRTAFIAGARIAGRRGAQVADVGRVAQGVRCALVSAASGRRGRVEGDGELQLHGARFTTGSGTFYRYALEQAGWTETTPAGAPAGLNFRKDGCEMSVYFSPAAERGSAGEGELQVSLHFAGNYDVRWLPKVSALESKNSYESSSHSMYRTRADLTDVEAALLKQFHAAGWTAYTRLASAGTEEPNSRTIAMLQGGSELTVSIGYPADAKDELVVATSVHVSNKSLPIPPDSGWIEFDSSTDLQAVINTKMDLQQTVEFYDERIAAEGWLAREASRQIKETTGRGSPTSADSRTLAASGRPGRRGPGAEAGRAAQ